MNKYNLTEDQIGKLTDIMRSCGLNTQKMQWSELVEIANAMHEYKSTPNIVSIKKFHEIRNCDVCNNEYQADKRNLKRGWGLCCSKSCAAKKREMSKPGYCPDRVKRNNVLRSNWEENYAVGDLDDDQCWDSHKDY